MKLFNTKVKKNKLQKLKNIIPKLLRYPVYSHEEFYKHVVSGVRSTYGFKSYTPEYIASILVANSIFKKGTINNRGKEQFYYFESDSNIGHFDIAKTVSRSAYFSFYSALYMNGLTNQIPKSIYMTRERVRIYDSFVNDIKQEDIDKSFSIEPRSQARNISFGKNSVIVINGQHQNEIGVVGLENGYRVSSIERTLIDCAIRPFYSGGVTEVLKAYRWAIKSRLSISSLYEHYEQMNLKYPYHQAIGFYLELAGAKEDDLKFFDQIPKEKKFYLSYRIKQKQYSKRWKLYFPEGLQ